jgi:hypothetical protein
MHQPQIIYRAQFNPRRLCAAHVQKMKQPIKPTHGGKRPGAGRKPGNPRQSLSIRISQPAMAKLEQLRQSTGISAGKLVEAMILNHKP